MREDRASTTAITVAFARGFSGANTGKIRDPYAVQLLPGLHARLLVGEPMIGAIERAALRDELARRGYSLVADTDSHDWLRTTAHGESLAVHLSERVAVAERR